MKRSLLVASGLLVAGLASSSSVVLARQNQPGRPTLAEVHVLNRDRADAIAVKIQSTGDVLPVTIVGEPSVAVSPKTTLGVRATRQVWEYRQLTVKSGEDSIAALNALGGDGWEALGAQTVSSSVVWTLKRPR
jgi:hypothetical protein